MPWINITKDIGRMMDSAGKPTDPWAPISSLLIEHGNSGIAVMDKGFRCLYANQAMARIVGCAMADILGRDLREHLSESSRAVLGDWKRLCRKPGRGDTKFELDFLRGDGGPRTVEVAAAEIKTADGGVIRVLYAFDISDRKRMREELAESERKYRLLVENIEEFFFEQDVAGNLIFFNEAMVRHSGFTRTELMGMNFREYVLPEDWDQVVAFYTGILKTGRPASGLLIRGRMKDGLIHYYEVRSNLKRNEEGRKIGFRSYARDVTAEKLYEQQLKAIIEGSPIPTIVLNKAHCITHWNKACEDLTGVRAGDIIGKDKQIAARYLKQPILSDFLIDGAPLEEISAFYATECRRSEVIKDAYEMEAFFSGLGEKGKWLYLTSAFLRDSDNRITGAIETLLDITVKKNAETNLKKMHGALEEKVRERTRELQDINTALEVLLKKRENDKRELEERVVFSIKEVLWPHLELLKKSQLNQHQQIYLEILEQNFLEICAPFIQLLSGGIHKLTTTEIQVINLIRQNKVSKEIADFLGVSPRTVEFHRDNIRKKLGIKNKKVNLRAYLLQGNRM